MHDNEIKTAGDDESSGEVELCEFAAGDLVALTTWNSMGVRNREDKLRLGVVTKAARGKVRVLRRGWGYRNYTEEELVLVARKQESVMEAWRLRYAVKKVGGPMRDAVVAAYRDCGGRIDGDLEAAWRDALHVAIRDVMQLLGNPQKPRQRHRDGLLALRGFAVTQLLSTIELQREQSRVRRLGVVLADWIRLFDEAIDAIKLDDSKDQKYDE